MNRRPSPFGIALFDMKCCSDPSRQFGKRLRPSLNRDGLAQSQSDLRAVLRARTCKGKNCVYQSLNRDRLPLSSTTELALHCAVLNRARAACTDDKFAKFERRLNEFVQRFLCVPHARGSGLLRYTGLEAAHTGRRFCDTKAAVLPAPLKTAARSARPR